jgi:hypothetical protein
MGSTLRSIILRPSSRMMICTKMCIFWFWGGMFFFMCVLIVLVRLLTRFMPDF